MAGDATVARDGIDRHPPGVTLLVTELVGPCLEDLEVVVARQARQVAGAGHPHLRLRLGVIGFQLRER